MYVPACYRNQKPVIDVDRLVVKPWGVSYSGGSFKFTILDTNGRKAVTQGAFFLKKSPSLIYPNPRRTHPFPFGPRVVAQLPQTSYMALQTPYSLFGLGRTNNYVEVCPFSSISSTHSLSLNTYVFGEPKELVYRNDDAFRPALDVDRRGDPKLPSRHQPTGRLARHGLGRGQVELAAVSVSGGVCPLGDGLDRAGRVGVGGDRWVFTFERKSTVPLFFSFLSLLFF